MAAGLLHHHLKARGLDIAVPSAGTRGVSLPVDPCAVQAAQRLGVDISAHTPRQFDRTVLAEDGADLIIAMTREHLRTVVTTDRYAFPRTFTLRELARRAAAHASPNETWGEWLAAMSAGRRVGGLLGDDPTDDVADPYGQGVARVKATAEELDELTRTLAALPPWVPG